MFYGLSTRDIRNLAFEFARAMEIPIPQNWADNKIADKDWFLAFMKRHPNLALRKPQATSIARAMCFNRPNVAMFFRLLSSIMDETKVLPQNIWNMDETGVKTVGHSDRVVAEKGAKQVGHVVSAERGALITVAVAYYGCSTRFLPKQWYPCRVVPASLHAPSAATGSQCVRSFQKVLGPNMRGMDAIEPGESNSSS